ncbi:MAG TPA: hypothetical protein VIL04_00650 [Solirubrobacterales bacterium]|jgi:hypothetical protein
MSNAMRPAAFAAVALVGALAALAAACGSDDAGASEDGAGERLTYVIEPADQTVTLVDNPGKRVAPPGSKLDKSKETPGDHAVQAAVLRDAAGERAGEIHAIFTTVGDPGIEAVSATLSLADGDLVAQGMIGNGTEDELAVVGGTRAYRGASGALRVQQDGDVVRIDIELEGE